MKMTKLQHEVKEGDDVQEIKSPVDKEPGNETGLSQGCG